MKNFYISLILILSILGCSSTPSKNNYRPYHAGEKTLGEELGEQMMGIARQQDARARTYSSGNSTSALLNSGPNKLERYIDKKTGYNCTRTGPQTFNCVPW